LFLFRLWEAGWKGRYYKNKFQLSENDEGYDDFRKKVVRFYNAVLQNVCIEHESNLVIHEECISFKMAAI